MTREQLAEEIDISSKFLYEVETGKYSFNIRILIRLSEIFHVSADYLLFGEDKCHTWEKPSEYAGIEENERERFRCILREILSL